MIIQGLARKPEQLRKSLHGRGRRDGNAAKIGSVASRLEREVTERAEQKAARTKGLEQAP